MAADSDDETRTSNEQVEDAAASPPPRLAAPLQVRDPDRYDVLGEHGRGGLGKVARAHDKELGRNVAIKELIKRGDIGEIRFLREAMITARLEHPGIVPIHEAGRWPDGTPFYVMKLVAGRSLRELLAERETVERRIALLHHVVAVADAVAYAHKRKIIHRDLKPANVIIGDFGETVVIDWGLAKDLSEPDVPAPDGGPYRTAALSDLTETGTVLGTPTYMPPEQWRGESVDQRADVFAIGAMLWELCSTSKVPPEDPRHRDRLLRRAGIDKDLGAILAKALARDPAQRYRDAGELAADLKAFIAGARIASRRYSLPALVMHWMRRHRALASAIAVVTVLALAGSLLYVRNISLARDRADAAAVRADTERAIASVERDNARLAQAAALLDKDPRLARGVLESIAIRTPQHALLTSRANYGAASHVFRVPGGFTHLRRHPVTSEVVFVSAAQALTVVDVDQNKLRVIDRDLQNALTSRAEGWVYARKKFDAPSATVATTTTPQQAIDVGKLLIDDASTLLASSGEIYAFDRGDLYTIETTGPVRIRREVHSFGGSDRVLMICTAAGRLEVIRDGSLERQARCTSKLRPWPMTAVGADYALFDVDAIVLVRGGRPVRIPGRAAGELALARSGLLGVVDLDWKPWFVRAGGDQLEHGPAHAARALTVEVDGRLVAWGFDDGVVIALDTETGQTWKLVGHTTAVGNIVLDAHRARLISAGGNELRVWPLPSSPAKALARLPCVAFNAVKSPEGERVALDCGDGIVRAWSPVSGELRELHRHDGAAYGIAWLGNAACSAGFDGRVLCTAHTETRELRPRSSRIRRFIGNPRGDKLFVATLDGEIAEAGGAVLYKHSAIPYSMAFTSDGRLLASGADDGSLIVYDTVKHQILRSTVAHAGLVTSVAWRQDELWTTSADGTIKRWNEVDGKLTLVETIAEQGTSRLHHVFPDGWVASIGGRALVIRRGAREMRLDFDRNVERCNVSADDRYIAIATTTEMVIVDLVQNAIAMVPVPSRGGYVGFVVPGTVTISSAGGLVGVPLASLEYIGYESNQLTARQ